jgi:hypothetical protein
MLSRLAWQELPDSLTLRDGGCLILQLPPQHRWPSEGVRLGL